MRKFYVPILLFMVAIFLLCLGATAGSKASIEYPPPPITVEQALEIIDRGRDSHQYYINHPELCSAQIGSVGFHRRWVKRYNQLEELILYLADKRYN